MQQFLILNITEKKIAMEPSYELRAVIFKDAVKLHCSVQDYKFKIPNYESYSEKPGRKIVTF